MRGKGGVSFAIARTAWSQYGFEVGRSARWMTADDRDSRLVSAV